MKRRFPIILKVVILGIGVSILTSGTAIIVSYFNQRSRGEANYIENIDNTLDAVDEVFTNEESQYTTTYLSSLSDSIAYVKDIYNNDPDKRGPEPGETFEEFANYYASKYPWIYPHDPRMGFISKEEADVKAAYYTILNIIDNFQMSSDSQSVFISFVDPLVENRMVFLADSRMDDSSRKPNDYYQVPGYYYEIQDSDYFDDKEHVKHRGYILDGYLTRFTDIYTVPTGDEEKQLIATLYIQYSLDKVYAESLDILQKELLVLGLSTIVLVLIYTAFSYLLFVKNINKLTKASSDIKQRLIDKKMNKVINIPVKSNDEMRLLADSFMEMEHAIINYVDIINKEAQEKQRTNAELSIASKIQLDSLPNSNYDDANISVRAYIKPAKEVGGDFYDYFYLDDHRLAVIISDVSGKGIPASLFMMKGKELIKSSVQSYSNLVDAINSVNKVLTKNNNELLFITSFIGIIDFASNEIRYINAGHEKPYIVSNNKVIKLDGCSNVVLGVEEKYNFVEESHKFNEGDYILMFTDGLNESINDKEEEFGYQRIEDTIANTSDIALSEVIDRLNQNLDSFTDSKEQFDDVTMLLIKNKKAELKLHYNEKDYKIIEDATNKFDEEFSFLDDKTRASVGIILDELLNNFISYEKKEDLEIDILFAFEKEGLKVELSSNGNDYNPFANHKEKFLEKYHSEIELGGFGLSIVKDLTKSHKYEFKNGHPTIILII